MPLCWEQFRVSAAIAEEAVVSTPPKHAPIAPLATPDKLSLQRKRLYKKSAWTPQKPHPMPHALIREVEEAAEAAIMANQGNPSGIRHKVAEHCRVCNRAKHSCAWETRANGHGSMCTGACCLSCSKATRSLGISRSMDVLEKAPAAMAVVRLWSEYFAELKRSRGEDICQCSFPQCKKRRTRQ